MTAQQLIVEIRASGRVVVWRDESELDPYIGIARRLYRLAQGGHRVPAFGGDMVPA